MKKDKIVLIVLILIVIGIVAGITYIRSNGNYDNPTMQCISSNSILIISKTCGHCANQIGILGDHKDNFEILYLDNDPTLQDQYNIKGVPTWVIGNKTYTGVRSIENLKQLTNCGVE